MTKNQGKSLPADLFIQSPFWQSKLQNLSHPVAVKMAQDLDQGKVLGIGDASTPFWKGFKHDFGKKDSNIDFLLRIKKQHPQKIILVQIGEFFETWGIDSIFLVEHCGINRMGRKGPRAGMPLANIQGVLDDLIANGFSVVICQQSGESSSSGKKLRFISEIITSSSPTYTYGLAMSHRANIAFPQVAPEFGISLNSKGIRIVEINPDLQTTLILDGLTSEAAAIRLNKYGGRINRIFIDDKISNAFLTNLGVKCDNLVTISNYQSKDFAKRMEELIKIDLALDANNAFLQISQNDVKNAPRPIYQTTAKQIGILPKVGIPNLIDLMLPKGSPSNCKYILKNILLNPPGLELAASIRKIIDELQESQLKLPILIVSNPARYVKTLNKKEAHPEILRDLFTLSNIFISCSKGISQEFIKHSLNVVSHLSSIKAGGAVLLDASKKIIEILTPILPIEEDLPFEPKSELISKYLFENIEDQFRGRISPNSNEKIAKLYEKSEKLALEYEEILTKKLSEITSGTEKKNISLSYDIHNKAIWISGKLNEELIQKHKLIRPLDRYGKQVKDRLSFSKAEDILEKYKNNANELALKIKELLCEISCDLSAYNLPIIHLATFSNLLKTLYLHAKECKPKDWSTNFISNEVEVGKIEIEEFFPYWIRSSQAISNSLTFDGTCLLTGHNMAGKSTTMRSIASVTLLGSCGFMFPAQKLEINGEIDGWFVRTGAQDDPEAGLSAFAVEMMDMKVALRDASNKSLLLIDELGKGTESKAGHAIAASILEHLAARNIRCVFATHWHEIFANPQVSLENIKMLKMKCNGDDPTYKLVEGIDLNSAAFYSAAKMGIDGEIISRAREIASGYDKNLLADIELFSSIHFVKEIFASVAQSEIGQVQNLKGGEIPSLIHSNCSVVYVLKTTNNFFYVGETDNFASRVKAHRYRFNKCEFLYIITGQGKSHARKLEQELILKLKNNNFPMISTSDESNLRFGT